MDIIKYYSCSCGYSFSEDESDDGECPLCGSFNARPEFLTEEEVQERELAKA